MDEANPNSNPSQGRLATILQAGFFELSDVSPASIDSYVKTLQAISPDQRIQAASQHTREALRHAFKQVKMLEQDVPPYGAWRALAEARYGTLPHALAVRDPEYVTNIQGVDMARMSSAVGFALEAAGVRWCLSGPLARCVFGEPRPVADLEFVATLEKAALPALTKQLGDAFWTNAAQLEEAAEQRQVAVAYHLATLTQVRFVPSADELQESLLSRRVRVEGAACGRLWVQTAEDSVLQGLLAWRDADVGEEILWRDVALILATQPGLDAGYLDGWAQKLDIADTLREARTQAGVGGGP